MEILVDFKDKLFDIEERWQVIIILIKQSFDGSISIKTHLSSLRPKQSRRTAISSLQLLCWIVDQVFGHQGISLLENSHRIIWGRYQLTLGFGIGSGLLTSPLLDSHCWKIIWGRYQLTCSEQGSPSYWHPAPPLALDHHSLFSQTPAPPLSLFRCPTTSKPPHPHPA